MWLHALKVAMGVGAGVTSFVWAVASYRAGEAALRVSAMTNQLALASICQVNNGTIDDALCGSYLATFNRNFASIASAVASGDGSASVSLYPAEKRLSLTIELLIAFLCTTAGVFVVLQVAEGARRRRESRISVHQLDEMTRDASPGESKAPGLVDYKVVQT